MHQDVIFITHKFNFSDPNLNLDMQINLEFLKSDSRRYYHNYSAFDLSFIRNKETIYPYIMLFATRCLWMAWFPNRWTLWLLPHVPLTFVTDLSGIWLSHPFLAAWGFGWLLLIKSNFPLCLVIFVYHSLYIVIKSICRIIWGLGCRYCLPEKTLCLLLLGAQASKLSSRLEVPWNSQVI